MSGLVLLGVRVLNVEGKGQKWNGEDEEEPMGLDWNQKCRYQFMISLKVLKNVLSFKRNGTPVSCEHTGHPSFDF